MPVYNQLSGIQLRQLSKFTNGTLGHPSAFSAAVGNFTNQHVFGGNVLQQQGVQTDATGVTQTEEATSGGLPVTIFNEIVSTPSTMTLTTNGHPNAIVLDTGAGINFTDAGSTGDSGDVIYGDNNTDMITTTMGNNLVIAGSGPTTLQGGSGSDTMWGGGMSSVVGGSGNDQKLVGGLSPGAHDTVVGGSGSGDTLWAGFGDVTMTAGTGTNQNFWSGWGGDDSMTLNDTSNVLLRDGTANFTISAGGNAQSHDVISADAGVLGNVSVTTYGGSNDISVGSAYNTINSAGDDSIYLVNGGVNAVKNTGSGSDTVFVGSSLADDSVTGSSSATTHIEYSANISPIDTQTSGGVTTVVFNQGTVVTYSGNVTISSDTGHNF
jgi:hypothetical protein